MAWRCVSFVLLDSTAKRRSSRRRSYVGGMRRLGYGLPFTLLAKSAASRRVAQWYTIHTFPKKPFNLVYSSQMRFTSVKGGHLDHILICISCKSLIQTTLAALKEADQRVLDDLSTVLLCEEPVTLPRNANNMALLSVHAGTVWEVLPNTIQSNAEIKS